MHLSALRRMPLLAAIALVCAAAGDACVEATSNTGAFGSSYFDGNQLSVIPTLVAGLLLALGVVTTRCIPVARAALGRNRDWMVEAACAMSARPIARDLPLVFAMQVGALFVMETIESLVMSGRQVEGAAWLGGPALFSLTVHLALCIAGVLLFRWLTRAFVAAFASLVRIALAFVTLPRAAAPPRASFSSLDIAAVLRAQRPYARHFGGRAPPRLLSLA